jgi:hypothetical protein
MQQAVSDIDQPLVASETRPLLPLRDDSVADHVQDGESQHCNDFDQQYIMLDGGVFVRLNDASSSAEAVLKQPSSTVPASGLSNCQRSHSDINRGLSPRLLIVPRHNMAVNSVSCAFSVGSRSFLVSPSCVETEGSVLSFLDGNIDFSTDSDGALMLWCSWFVFDLHPCLCSFLPISVLGFSLIVKCHLIVSQVHELCSSHQRCTVFRRFRPYCSSLLSLPPCYRTGAYTLTHADFCDVTIFCIVSAS